MTTVQRLSDMTRTAAAENRARLAQLAHASALSAQARREAPASRSWWVGVERSAWRHVASGEEARMALSKLGRLHETGVDGG